MKSIRRVVALAMIGLSCSIAFSGCRTTSQYKRSARQYDFRRSRLLAMFYLKALFNRNMWKEAYESLTRESRKEVSFGEFVRLVREQVPEALVDPADQDIRTEVRILHWEELSETEADIHALLSLYYPYEEGERDSYRVVRLNCRKRKKVWKIQPRYDSATDMIVLIPTRFYGPLWRFADEHDSILREIVGEKPAAMEEPHAEKSELEPLPAVEPELPPVVEPEPAPAIEAGIEQQVKREAVAEAELKPVTAEPEIPAQIVPPVPEVRTRIDTDAVIVDELKTAIRQQVDSLINVGKLHIETGEVIQAEQKFIKALELDPGNETVLTYLEYCRKYHEIKGETEAELRLIKAMLDIVGE